MPVTTGRIPQGRIAVRWHLAQGRWVLDGIDLPPAADELRTTGRHPRAAELLELLADPQRRSGVPWALDATERSGLRPFAWSVLEALAVTVPAGQVVSYGELAERVGHPGAARAVGSVMRTNRWPLLVPCHRVIAAGGRIGGFQSNRADGRDRKRSLLAEEGVRFSPGGAVVRVEHG